MGREGCERIRLDGFASLCADRAASKLLDDRMVIAQFDTPHILIGIVVLGIGRIERISTTPDAFPKVELVMSASLERLVVNAELHTISGTKQEGLPLAIGS